MDPKPDVSFDDFLKLDIRAGTITAVEVVPKSKKLLKLTVALGNPIGDRTIIAGIAQAKSYGEVVEGAWKDSCLIGQHILVVVNLAPKEFKNIGESHGMLLAGHTPEDQIYLCTIPPMVVNGSDIG